MQITSFIDNSAYRASESEFILHNPYTSELLHQVEPCDLMGVVLAIQSANRAFAEWKGSSLEERCRVVEKIAGVLQSRRLEYARAEALNQGLPLEYVLRDGLDASIRYLAEKLTEAREYRLSDEYRHYPVGPIAIVASWNLSLRVILDRLIPALLAGNTVVVKVSSWSPVSAHILAEIISEIQAPAGLVNILISRDSSVKNTLVSHPGIRAVTLCGRIETVSQVMGAVQQASLQNFKKIQFSSGSKNSAVALYEPPEEVFSEIMDSFLIGQGQLHWNSARLFFLEKSEIHWQDRIQAYLNDLRPSQSIEDDSPWTPCLRPESFTTFDELKKIASDDKAKLLESPYVLSDSQKKRYLSPVFTKDMSRCSTLQQDQVHAPVFILSAVKYPFDVAKYSNVSYFGSAAHLWGDPEKLRKVADGLDVGLVSWNRGSSSVLGPAVAVKQSGYGLQDFGIFGAFFSNVKKIT